MQKIDKCSFCNGVIEHIELEDGKIYMICVVCNAPYGCYEKEG